MNGLPILRLALMVLARRQKENRAQYREAIRDRAVLEAMTCELTVRAESELGSVGDGSFMDWFQWLLENWELILSLISLFMAKGDIE